MALHCTLLSRYLFTDCANFVKSDFPMPLVVLISVITLTLEAIIFYNVSS